MLALNMLPTRYFVIRLFIVLLFAAQQSCIYSKKNIKKLSSVSVENNVLIDSLSNELLKQMHLHEKIKQLSGEAYLPGLLKLGCNFMLLKRFPHIYAGHNKRLGIPPFCFSDGPRGATVEGHQNTVFPVAMARGASWDIALEREVAKVIGKEIRASGCNYTGNPCINLLRHPGWGRAQETYGEDPWHLGQFGLNFVQAVQQHQVMACPKHFALNSIENARFYIDVQADERSLREVYLPQFKKVIIEGKAASIMSAYNRFRGEYCGENRYLLEQILRKDWQFDGFVSSDWVWGLYDTEKGIKAGLDVEMPVRNKYSFTKVKKLLRQAQIDTSSIDKMVNRVIRTKLKFSLLKDSTDYPKTLKGHASHIELAQKVAEESMVLLKNEGILPFSIQKGMRVALIGRLAKSNHSGDHGSSHLTNKDIVNAYEGLKNFCQQQGAILDYSSYRNPKKAKQLVQSADLVVLYVGFDYKQEGEYLINSKASDKRKKIRKNVGGDRYDLNLTATDIEMINQLAGLQKNTVLVYSGGSAISMQAWQQKVPVILFSWYSGMRGGTALANILFGKVNPSGKLPFTVFEKATDYPYFDPQAKQIEYGYYHGYTLADKKQYPVAYPFGYGLNYSHFEIKNLFVSKPEVVAGDSLQLSVDIQNNSAIAGAEVCQVYVGFKHSSIDRPVKLLRAFRKVRLQAFESQTIQFCIDSKDLRFYNPDSKQWEFEYMPYEIYVGNSAHAAHRLQNSFQIVPSLK